MSRVLYEDASRNTYENALLSARLSGVDNRQPWLLLTSAFHMPRAMGVFSQTGWNVTPWPVDYRMTPHDSWFDFSLHYGPRLWSTGPARVARATGPTVWRDGCDGHARLCTRHARGFGWHGTGRSQRRSPIARSARA